MRRGMSLLEILVVSECFVMGARRLFVQLSLARALKRIRRPEVVANQGEIKPRRIAKGARLGSLNHMIRPFELIEPVVLSFDVLAGPALKNPV